MIWPIRDLERLNRTDMCLEFVACLQKYKSIKKSRIGCREQLSSLFATISALNLNICEKFVSVMKGKYFLLSLMISSTLNVTSTSIESRDEITCSSCFLASNESHKFRI